MFAKKLDERSAPGLFGFASVADGDQLEVVEAEANDGVLGPAAGVSTAGTNVEAEVSIALNRRLEVADGNDEVVKTIAARGSQAFTYGSTSRATRSNWPNWSQDDMRRVMRWAPVPRKARRLAMHSSGLPKAPQASIFSRVKLAE